MTVSSKMHEHIVEQLKIVAEQRKVRILFAAESGSRAWGFASPNSDYDVRFIYLAPLPWHLKLRRGRDVIENMLPNDVDLSGFELTKALRLMLRYNGALQEWLKSPIRYQGEEHVFTELQTLAAISFNSAAALHHYASMARNAFLNLDSGIHVVSKRLCYLLRAVYCCRYIASNGKQPPTDFSSMREQLALDANEQEFVDAVLAQKSVQKESGLVILSAERRARLSEEIDQALVLRACILKAHPKHPEYRSATARAEQLWQKLLLAN